MEPHLLKTLRSSTVHKNRLFEYNNPSVHDVILSSNTARELKPRKKKINLLYKLLHKSQLVPDSASPKPYKAQRDIKKVI
jgi:hypothetical protein